MQIARTAPPLSKMGKRTESSQIVALPSSNLSATSIAESCRMTSSSRLRSETAISWVNNC
jgi:hypothetical protein